jgi:integrase
MAKEKDPEIYRRDGKKKKTYRNGKPMGLARGSSIPVDPIRFKRHRFLIRELLRDNPRDLLLFVMGINNGLRMKDLLSIKVGQIRDLNPGEHIRIRESKTKKMNYLAVNEQTHRALQNFFKHYPDLKDDEFLFRSRSGKKLESIIAGRMVASWCRAVGIKGHFGAHSLRKTWAYVQRKEGGASWEMISTRLNHSNLDVTKRYLGIHEDEIVEMLQFAV